MSAIRSARSRTPTCWSSPRSESANIAYKLLARLGNAKAIGPVLVGVGAPVHVLQTGDEVDAIVQVAAIAAVDAMSR